MNRLELIQALKQALRILEDARAMPCSREVDGVGCTMQFYDKTDRRGRAVFYYDTGCQVVEEFCPACAAHWHAAVALNKVYELERLNRFETRGEMGGPPASEDIGLQAAAQALCEMRASANEDEVTEEVEVKP